MFSKTCYSSKDILVQKIYFLNLSQNWSESLLLVSALIILLTGYGVLFSYENKFLIVIGFLAILVYLSRMFWFKNYVGYNKIGMLIKTHYIKSKSLKFCEVESLTINDKALKIKSLNKTIEIKIKDILDSDINKLIEILIEYSNNKLLDHRHTALSNANFQN